MILGFRDRRTEAFAAGERVREFAGFDRQGWKRLEVLEAATSLANVRALPSNRLEGVKGDRVGQFSIRINAQWRICFLWRDGEAGPSDVEIIDCHREEIAPCPVHRSIPAPSWPTNRPRSVSPRQSWPVGSP